MKAPTTQGLMLPLELHVSTFKCIANTNLSCGSTFGALKPGAWNILPHRRGYRNYAHTHALAKQVPLEKAQLIICLLYAAGKIIKRSLPKCPYSTQNNQTRAISSR